ncbi:MAG: PCRF domain-containing protein, partial [Candidatus Neomarinimicrobiota bacterium]|nr:PCRF domain-containing protein [Candidatus Neomarinimicrobiota bacterium]
MKNFLNYGGIFDLQGKKEELIKMRQLTTDEKFWSDNKAASFQLKKISILEKEINLWKKLDSSKSDYGVLIEFFESGEVSLDEVKNELSNFVELVEDVELKTILGEEQDTQNAIMTIHPGAGGTESQDWAEMLYRMYSRWFEIKGFKKSVIDFQPGDEAGIKDITIEISGEYAFGLLKAEVGVHRLVRISPFDSNSRRHTSFASVFVYPSSEEEIEIEIDQNDLRIDTYRASGAGGQHVNKTDSAIRITHIPTGL